jgi:hypothetical protein
MITKTIEIYQASRGRTTCRGASCGAPIEWAEVVNSGKRLCFDAPITPLRTFPDERGRLVDVVDLSRSHWATCPDTKSFRRKG